MCDEDDRGEGAPLYRSRRLPIAVLAAVIAVCDLRFVARCSPYVDNDEFGCDVIR